MQTTVLTFLLLLQKIQLFMDTAEHGVIYFSLGGNIKSTLLPEVRLAQMMRAFGKLKQKVLFKWENETLPNKPKNVMTAKWFPQNDVLGKYDVYCLLLQV